MIDLQFTVPGRPQQKSSKRPFRTKAGGIVLVDMNKRAKPFAAAVAVEAATVSARDLDGELLRGAIMAEFAFFFARPRSHFGTGRNRERVLASAPRQMIVMPDIDKLARTVLDALTGIVFKDDAQVCELRLRKGYGEPERLEARVVGL